MKNRLIQFHGSSSFNSLSQNIPFYQSTTTPLKPYLGKGIGEFRTVLHCATAQKYGRKAEKQKRFHTTNRNCCCCRFFFFVRFSSNKSLSTTYFFLMVIKNTLLVSQRHSLDWNNTALLAKLPHRIRCIYLQLSILRRDNFELFQFKLIV